MGVLRLRLHKRMLSEFVEERENEIMNMLLTITEVSIIIFFLRTLPKNNIENKCLPSTRDSLKVIV